MPSLTEEPTLGAFQRYVAELELERGFSEQTLIEKCLLLGEEVGELFKAVRKAANLTIDPNSKVSALGDELADCLIYLCAIANRCDVDLELAFRTKERFNKEREWVKPNAKETGQN